MLVQDRQTRYRRTTPRIFFGYESTIGDWLRARHLGSQEVEAVIPDAVHTALDGYKGVNYQSLTGLLIEAIKELRTQNETLKADVEELKKSMN